jgi:hypothetical protein
LRLLHDLEVRIRQYVYFSVYSETAATDEIASYLGLGPDRIRVRGSRSTDPPRPRHHAWQVLCDSPGLRIDEQVASVLNRLREVEDRLVTIGGDLLGQGGGCYLQLVRYFDDDEGEEEDLSSADAPLQKLAGQHQLLGWHLEADSVSFLARVGAEIDCDEYG